MPVETPVPMPADVGEGGLLAVHAHPDDETLSTGALIAATAAAGLPVTVVTCTRGERGEVIALPGTTSAGQAALEGDGPALAAWRTGELRAALTALGGGDPGAVGHRFLDELEPPAAHRFEDSGMVWVRPGTAGPDPSVTGGFCAVPLDDAAKRLARLVRELRPAVVATYEEGGGYGHPDHVRAHQVTVRALELAADPAFDDGHQPWSAELWQRVTPEPTFRVQRYWLAASRSVRELAETVGLAFPGADDPLAAVVRSDAVLGEARARRAVAEVEVRPVVGRVVAAMRAHATQIQHAEASTTPVLLAAADVLGRYALSNGVLAPIGGRETYLVTRPLGVAPRSGR